MKIKMKKTLSLFYLLVLLIIFVGCATTSNIGKVTAGMSQEEVLNLCGKPISTEFDENTSSWLYKNVNSTQSALWPQRRYYWITFNKNNTVIAVKDGGAVESSGSSSSGMGFMCKQAIASGDELGVKVHCK
jgi:outer membrane protein assembly factor BamE (lipoprotein component of BamABCDE complex)